MAPEFTIDQNTAFRQYKPKKRETRSLEVSEYVMPSYSFSSKRKSSLLLLIVSYLKRVSRSQSSSFSSFHDASHDASHLRPKKQTKDASHLEKKPVPRLPISTSVYRKVGSAIAEAAKNLKRREKEGLKKVTGYMEPEFIIDQNTAVGQYKPKLKKYTARSPEVSEYVVPEMFSEFEIFPLKGCLLYCLLLPRGYEFERDTLVQLWIAEELIEGEATDRMEDLGDECFEILASKEYIVPSRFDKACSQLKYTVNDSKISLWCSDRGYSLDNFVSTDAGELNDIPDTTLYLSLRYEKFDPQIFEALQRFKKLRTLLLLGHYGCLIKEVPRDLFLSLKFLKTLDLSQTQISELPSSVGNLESLRYFDLSYTLIRGLPELLCSLYSLQILKLRDCFTLFALPMGLSKLINLRHLDFDIVGQLSSMPKSMGKLKNLQTLKGFIVGTDDGCGIGELGDMGNITGSFFISRLENVSTAEEAKKADLRNKKYLTKLEMRWKDCINAESEKEILECLEPHTGLKELQIQFYSGSALPGWISNPSFSSIFSITLFKCVNCHFLPSIGDLPSLKFLNIVGMENVGDINSLFCRSDHRNQGYCAFPKLERLILDGMLNLEEWTGVETGDFPCLLRLSIRYCPKLLNLPLMSDFNCLKYMELSQCYELQSLLGGLPTSLDSLIIQDCPKLKEQCHKNGEDWVKIAHVPNVWIDHHEISSTEDLP